MSESKIVVGLNASFLGVVEQTKLILQYGA